MLHHAAEASRLRQEISCLEALLAKVNVVTFDGHAIADAQVGIVGRDQHAVRAIVHPNADADVLTGDPRTRYVVDAFDHAEA